MTSNQTGSRVAAVIACYIVPIPFEILSTGLRIYAKQRQSHRGLDRFTIDDFFIVFATCCAVGECCIGLAYGPPHGFGKHIDQVSAQNFETFEVGNYIFSHFYNITLGMIKLSILTFYYRIFIIPAFRRVVLATITFIALWVLAITVVLALECRPIAKFWHPTLPGKCFNLVAFSYFTNISNLVTDLWIFFLPIPVIWRLQISNHQRLGLCGVFLIGLGTCIISSVRISVVVAQGSTDFTWVGVPLGIMSVFEPLGGILSANLPITYSLFANSFRKVRNTISGPLSGHLKHRGRLSQSSNNRFARGQDAEDRWIQLDPQAGWETDSKPLANAAQDA